MTRKGETYEAITDVLGIESYPWGVQVFIETVTPYNKSCGRLVIGLPNYEKLFWE